MKKNRYAKESRKCQGQRRLNRACLSKKAFATADEARQPGQDIYRCRHCGQWHRTGAAAALAAVLGRRRPLLSQL